MIRVCFVCLGNICRSPTAEGIFRHLVASAGLEDEIEIASAGTGAWHVGALPDPRSRATALGRGLRLVSRARKLEARDLDHFDYVLAMDTDNLAQITSLAGSTAPRARVSKLLAFHPERDDDDVPDPYEGGPRGFEDVFDLCAAACRGLLEHLRRVHGLDGGTGS